MTNETNGLNLGLNLGLNRRKVLQASAAGLAAALAPGLAKAQGTGPIRIGTLTPLTGAGGSYGPIMRDIVAAVVRDVNAAGGVLGRQIQLISEDDQTNPEAAVRAARKLIDVDNVIAIMGTWASSVTTAVAPLCWQNRIPLFTVSGADTITRLPHLGYIFRTQPDSQEQFKSVIRYMHASGGTRIGYMGPQAPFVPGWLRQMEEYARANNLQHSNLIYEADKTSLRSEVETMMRNTPNFIFLGGYATDTAVLLRDLFRAGYTGRLIAPAYAANQTLVNNQPPEVTNGLMVYEPWGAVESEGFKRIQRMLNRQDIDPYTAQCYDHINLALLAIARSGTATGESIKDTVRTVSQGGGTAVNWVLDGLPLIRANTKIDFTGASGPCDFDAIGDISGVQYRFARYNNRVLETVRIGS
jgi:branched-chain amino acid transport system substrate-binding protein